jgi:hypothetical protein
MRHIIRERLVLGVVHMASVVEAIVFFATLGFWSIELRGAVLFSDWAENFIERKLK